MKSKPKPAIESFNSDGISFNIIKEKEKSITANWKVDNLIKKDLEKVFNLPWEDLFHTLRLYDITERDIQEDGLDHYIDFTINPFAQKWVLNGVEEGRKYCVDYGIRKANGRFLAITRSNELQL